jgi:small ubiquitin-related modifier
LQSGEETFFKIKRSTKLAKVFESYSIKKGVQSSSLRFMLDGERVDGEQTAADLDLEDQDQIDCLLEQTGGF